MHPLVLLIGGITNFFSLALLGLDVYLFREWYEHKGIGYTDEYAQRCLVFAIIILVFVCLGRIIWGLILGKRGSNEPNQVRTSEFIELERPEGHLLHVEFYGPTEAQPIIMIHGWSSNSTQWFYFKQTLAKDFRLILVDLPGLGKSGKPKNNDYSLDKFSRDLEAVIDLCGDKKPILLGHSIGGMTILTACKLQGKKLYARVRGLVLLHTTYTDPSHTAIMSGLLTALEKPVFTPMLYIMIALAPLFQLMNWIKYFNGSMHISNAMSGFAGTETKGQLNLTALLSTIAPVDVVARGCLAMFKYDATEVLSTIDLPVLMVCGENDILTKASAGHHIATSIPKAKLVTLLSCAHMGVLERNQEEIQAVSFFAKEISQVNSKSNYSLN